MRFSPCFEPDLSTPWHRSANWCFALTDKIEHPFIPRLATSRMKIVQIYQVHRMPRPGSAESLYRMTAHAEAVIRPAGGGVLVQSTSSAWAVNESPATQAGMAAQARPSRFVGPSDPRRDPQSVLRP